MRSLLFGFGLAFFYAWPAVALEPKEILVISNRNVPTSQRIAEHYLVMRGVPAENHIQLLLPTGEEISRADYEKQLALPLRKVLILRRKQIKCLLTISGVPLRIGPKIMTAGEQAEENRLKVELQKLNSTIQTDKIPQIQKRLNALSTKETVSSVDSELMLIWWPDHPLSQWTVNPMYFAIPEEYRRTMPPVMLTSRIDGPSNAIALRLINDAVAVERHGLQGKAYIDARGIAFNSQKPGEVGIGYEGYDESFREAAALLQHSGLDVTLDNRQELFAPGSCSDCALYAGWYSLGKYVPAFQFKQGAVAWHLASSEAITLRDPKSKLWCPNLLMDGVAVTIGPVAEPYTLGFPKPAEFFGYLATGKYTLAECYGKTTMVTSWMMVLIGDPLYNPFAKHPLIQESEIHTSPKGIGFSFVDDMK